MFNGLGDWFENRTAFTFNIIAKPASTIVGSGFLFLVSNTTHTTPHYRFGVWFSTTGFAWYINATSTNLNIGGTYDADTYYNIILTYDGSIIKVYMDGVEVGSLVYSTAIGACHANASIGRIPANNSTSNYALHEVNELRIFNRALTYTEVQKLTHATVDPMKLKVFYPTSNFNGKTTYDDYMLDLSPAAYYLMDETAGTDVVDELGGTAGTYVNSPTLGTNDTMNTLPGTSVQLTGASSHYINMDQASDYQPTATNEVVTFVINIKWQCH